MKLCVERAGGDDQHPVVDFQLGSGAAGTRKTPRVGTFPEMKASRLAGECCALACGQRGRRLACVEGPGAGPCRRAPVVDLIVCFWYSLVLPLEGLIFEKDERGRWWHGASLWGVCSLMRGGQSFCLLGSGATGGCRRCEPRCQAEKYLRGLPGRSLFLYPTKRFISIALGNGRH